MYLHLCTYFVRMLGRATFIVCMQTFQVDAFQVHPAPKANATCCLQQQLASQVHRHKLAIPCILGKQAMPYIVAKASRLENVLTHEVVKMIQVFAMAKVIASLQATYCLTKVIHCHKSMIRPAQYPGRQQVYCKRLACCQRELHGPSTEGLVTPASDIQLVRLNMWN